MTLPEPWASRPPIRSRPSRPPSRASAGPRGKPKRGLPETIHVDNAKEFRSKAMKRGAEEHGISLQYRPIGAPHYAGRRRGGQATLSLICGTAARNASFSAAVPMVTRAHV
ncbi:hypothetical protein BSK21_09570 [Marivivens sp. JLT3646]|nr:hypothetical protein BSK21_09570 [Marivivens sp. JLT3646]